jgi:hypothetical protein
MAVVDYERNVAVYIDYWSTAGGSGGAHTKGTVVGYRHGLCVQLIGVGKRPRTLHHTYDATDGTRVYGRVFTRLIECIYTDNDLNLPTIDLRRADIASALARTLQYRSAQVLHKCRLFVQVMCMVHVIQTMLSGCRLLPVQFVWPTAQVF